MSDLLSDFEALPFELVEEIKAKSLAPFIAPTQSLNQITVVVYENQKYRRMIASWGSTLGVHLGAMDRRPFTDDRGKTVFPVPSKDDLTPLTGYVWSGEWQLYREDGLTDPDGFTYARTWSGLNEEKASSAVETTFSTVRRRKWYRAMVVDLDCRERTFPYELLGFLVVKLNGEKVPTNTVPWNSLGIEIRSNDELIAQTTLTAPNWQGQVSLPLTMLDGRRILKMNITRVSMLGTLKSVVECSLGDILTETRNISTNPTKAASGTQRWNMEILTDRSYHVEIEWALTSRSLFQVKNIEHTLTDGQLSTMLTEQDLSQRLKERILMLSLSLNSDCNTIFRQLTNIMADGHNNVNDVDLLEVLADLVYMYQRKNGYEKVLSLLRDNDAEKSHVGVVLSYPYDICCFTKYTTLQLELNRQLRLRRAQKRELVFGYREIAAILQQPLSSLSSVLTSKHSMMETALKQHNHSKGSEPFWIKILTKSSSIMKEFNLMLRFDTFYSYCHGLRIFSLAKNASAGIYDYSMLTSELLNVSVSSITINGDEFANLTLSLNFSTSTVELFEHDDEEALVGITFAKLGAMIVSHAHYLSLDRVLEVRLVSASTLVLNGSAEYPCKVILETDTGEQLSAEFILTQESINSGNIPATGTINETLRILVPAHTDTSNSSFASITFLVDQANTVAHRAPSNSISNFGESSFNSESRLERKSSARFSLGFGKSSSSSSSSSNRSHRESVSIPTISPVSFDAPRIKRNPSKFVTLGRAMLPPMKQSEQEATIMIAPSTMKVCLSLRKLLWSEAKFFNSDAVYYCVAFLISRSGEVIPCASSSSGGKKSLLKKKSSSSMGGSKHSVATHRGGYFFRSNDTDSDSQFKWLAGEAYGEFDSQSFAAANDTTHVLVEIYSNTSGADTLVGSAHIPLSTAMATANDSLTASKTESFAAELEDDVPSKDRRPEMFMITPSKGMASTSTKVSLGFLVASAKISVASSNGELSSGTSTHTPAMPPTPTHGSHLPSRRFTGTLVKVELALKQLTSSECSWPAQVFSSDHTLDSNVFSFGVSPEGVTLTADRGPLSSIATERLSILADCMESVRRRTAGPLALLVPFSQINIHEVCPLTEATLLVEVRLRRLISTASSSSSSSAAIAAASKSVYREFQLEILVGPCRADELFSLLANKIMIQPFRSRLNAYLSGEDREDDSFHRLASAFQDSIYETVLRIDERNTAALANGADQLTTDCSIMEDDDHDGQDSLNPTAAVELDREWLELITSQLCHMGMRLLYLKNATLQFYLWFLMERADDDDITRRRTTDVPLIVYGSATDGDPSDEYIPSPEDGDNLIGKIQSIMKTLERDVRCVIFQSYRQEKFDAATNLSRLIHTTYNRIVAILLTAVGDHAIGGTPATVKNPQKKRDLIKFIVTNDSIVENHLAATFYTHRFRFTVPPCLSLVLNYESLIYTFGSILDANLRMWNSRTLQHYMSSSKKRASPAIAASGDSSASGNSTENSTTGQNGNNNAATVNSTTNSQGRNSQSGTGNDTHKSSGRIVIPWDITIMTDEIGRERFLSSIPETIQMQLNVEIGLKRIAQNVTHHLPRFTAGERVEEAQRQVSRKHVETMNAKICQAIIRSYLALASQYEQALLSTTLVSSNDGDVTGLTSEEKDELLVFLCSVLNDCERINRTHVPQSISLFSNDKPPSCNALDDVVRPENRPENDVLSTLTFSTCLRSIATVALKAENELTNQFFFQSELRTFFLLGLDDFFLLKHRRADKLRSSVLQGMSNPAYRGAGGEHSSMEVILATLGEFLEFISRHISTEDLEKVMYLALEKMIVRYLLSLRDFHLLLRSPKLTCKSLETMSYDANGNPTCTLAEEMCAQVTADNKALLRFYSETRDRLFPAVDIIDKKNVDEGNESMKTRNGLASGSRYERMLMLLLKHLSNIVIITTHEPAQWDEARFIDRFLFQHLSIVPPPSIITAKETLKAYRDLETFLRTDSGFIHFIPPAEPTLFDDISSPSVSMQDKSVNRRFVKLNLRNLICHNRHAAKSLMLRVSLNNATHKSVVRQNALAVTSGDVSILPMNVTQWEDVMTFDEIVEDARLLKIEVYGYKLRAFRSRREQFIGEVNIDLVDLLRSELNTEAIALHEYPQEESSGFIHTAWYTVTQPTLLQGRRIELSHAQHINADVGFTEATPQDCGDGLQLRVTIAAKFEYKKVNLTGSNSNSLV